MPRPPGYSRQQIVQGTNVPLFTGAGFVGQGTHVETVRRIYDQFLNRQVLSAEAGAAEMDSYLAQIRQIDNLLADTECRAVTQPGGILQGRAGCRRQPDIASGRQSMLSAAQSLTADSRRWISAWRKSATARTQVAEQITQINTYSAQLADINQRIVLAQARVQPTSRPTICSTSATRC
jgi:flagellar hook-associated protein 1 FlgK